MKSRLEPANAQSAKSAGLIYVTDRMPGIQRRRRGRGFRYVDHRGRVLRHRADLDRIASLAIPPAWKDVWICPNAKGHLQACGRDARGRKQYRYHAGWRQCRDEAKYDQMLAFAMALPTLRRQIAKDLSAAGLQRRNRHVRVSRSTLRFRFKGKGGKSHDIAFDDVRLARIVRRCQDLPGHELFGYVDDAGEVQDIGSADVNEYLREVTGQDFTAKSFRTWAATVLAACSFQDLPERQSQTQTKRNVVKAVEAVAELLGNTPTICRKSYPPIDCRRLCRWNAAADPPRQKAIACSGSLSDERREAERCKFPMQPLQHIHARATGFQLA